MVRLGYYNYHPLIIVIFLWFGEFTLLRCLLERSSYYVLPEITFTLIPFNITTYGCNSSERMLVYVVHLYVLHRDVHLYVYVSVMYTHLTKSDYSCTWTVFPLNFCCLVILYWVSILRILGKVTSTHSFNVQRDTSCIQRMRVTWQLRIAVNRNTPGIN